MNVVSSQFGALPALRVKRDDSGSAELFRASLMGLTYKGLPVCSIADGRPFVTQIKAAEAFELLGPPTHYFLGSTDPCWLLSEDEFSRLKSETAGVTSVGAGDDHLAAAGWLSPMARSTNSTHNQQLASPSVYGGGMLTQHIVLT